MTHKCFLTRILPLTLAIVLLVVACASPSIETEAPLSPTESDLPPSAPTEVVPVPDGGVKIRLEYYLTAETGTLVIQGMEDAVAFDILEMTGSMNEEVGPDRIHLLLSDDAQEANLVIDVTLPEDVERIITFTSEHHPYGGSITSIYLLPDEGESLLIYQFDHRWKDDLNEDTSSTDFTLDLGSLTGLPIASIPPVEDRSHLIVCGQIIKTDTTLTNDMVCPPDTFAGLRIATSNITLDLGGHTITCSPINSTTGIFGHTLDGITIRNGTVEDCGIGIGLTFIRDVTLEDLTFRILNEDPDRHQTGTSITAGDNVVVRNSIFIGPDKSIMHKELAVFADSNVTIENIEVRGGSVGVSFGGGDDCHPDHNRVNGTVRNSLFSYTGSGILVACTSSALIVDNEFDHAEIGVYAYGPHYDVTIPRSITNLSVENNYIHDSYIGIDFLGVKESRIVNNVIERGHWGISLRMDMKCLLGGPVEDCYYATDNVISDNKVMDHDLDLYHHENALGNTWEGNTCERKEGTEIPECD